jgi:hypothetical protein
VIVSDGDGGTIVVVVVNTATFCIEKETETKYNTKRERRSEEGDGMMRCVVEEEAAAAVKEAAAAAVEGENRCLLYNGNVNTDVSGFEAVCTCLFLRAIKDVSFITDDDGDD